jgi:hypothetical protein
MHTQTRDRERVTSFVSHRTLHSYVDWHTPLTSLSCLTSCYCVSIGVDANDRLFCAVNGHGTKSAANPHTTRCLDAHDTAEDSMRLDRTSTSISPSIVVGAVGLHANGVGQSGVLEEDPIGRPAPSTRVNHSGPVPPACNHMRTLGRPSMDPLTYSIPM